MPQGRQRNPLIQKLVKQFEDMRVGDSFFVPGATPKDVALLRRPVTARGCGIAIWKVERDEIYHQPGVRVMRKEGICDQL